MQERGNSVPALVGGRREFAFSEEQQGRATHRTSQQASTSDSCESAPDLQPVRLSFVDGHLTAPLNRSIALG